MTLTYFCFKSFSWIEANLKEVITKPLITTGDIFQYYKIIDSIKKTFKKSHEIMEKVKLKIFFSKNEKQFL